jgi:glycosyltransferase involved in cell wall biosynthesis
MSADLLLLTRYGPLGASSRVRFYQYIPSLEAAGLRVEVRAMLSDSYVSARHSNRWRTASAAATGYARRALQLARLPSRGILWVEYELLPWLPYRIERALYESGRRVIVEYDDAVFHRYGLNGSAIVRRWLGDKIERVMAAATVVIVGNDYLAAQAQAAGARRVEIVPSVIDLARYRQRTTFGVDRFVIGWVGSGSTTPYLTTIEPALRQLVQEAPEMNFHNVGGTQWRPSGIPVTTVPWRLDTEVDAMQAFDVGVMPLPDDPWTRGKCGYKLIQYMGCGLPVVASPVGVNTRIVEHGRTGFLASSTAEWHDALRALARSPKLRQSMGHAGFDKVRSAYDLSVTAPRIVALMRDIASGRG